MGRYDVFMHLSLLESVPKSGLQRRRIMDFVRSLRDRPDAPGDFTDNDASQRVRQVKIIGDYAVTYWVDAPVKAVMVVDVARADQ
jgi:mRNA-degrading endonuclease RelE of RelBE toxin-antitoxin system